MQGFGSESFGGSAQGGSGKSVVTTGYLPMSRNPPAGTGGLTVGAVAPPPGSALSKEESARINALNQQKLNAGLSYGGPDFVSGPGILGAPDHQLGGDGKDTSVDLCTDTFVGIRVHVLRHAYHHV